MIVKVGCCGFPISKNKYYDEFGIVELQTTFYNIPREKTLLKWREEAPEDFEFIVKAFQGITHPMSSPTWRRYRGELPGEKGNYGLLKHTEEVFWSWEKTLDIARLLKTNKILIQLPPKCELNNESLSTLKEFLEHNILLILEPRHKSWFVNNVIKFFIDNGIVLCVDPFKNEPKLTGKLHYWRLHGRNGYKYGYKYSEEDLHELVYIVKKNSDAEELYILFNNKFMYENARTFRELIKGAGYQTA